MPILSYDDVVELGDGVVVPRDFTATVSWSGDVAFDVIARVHCNAEGIPVLVGAEFRSEAGLPLAMLQQPREFRWSWLLEHVVGLYSLGPEGVDARGVTVRSIKRRSRRPVRTDDRHMRIAERYRDYPGRDVVRHIAATEAVPYSTARRWVAEARDAGFLEPTSPGRRGEPTPTYPNKAARR